MSNYYISSSNLIFSLYENRIMYNSGDSVTDNRKECTQYWFLNQEQITITDFIQISNEVSGSTEYIKDRGW